MNNEIVQQFKNGVSRPDFKSRFLELIRDEPTFAREMSFATMAIAQSEYLQKCSVDSLIRAVFSVATTGLSLNPTLKFAAITPRYISGNYEAVLSPMYQGLVKIVVESGSATSIKTHIVYEGDDFEIQLGDIYSIKHSPRFVSKEIKVVYSIANLHDGTRQIEYMDKEEIERVRASSDSYRSFVAGRIKKENCIWEMHFPEMARKTVLRRIIKYIPKTEKLKRLEAALSLDDSDFPADNGKLTYIENLIHTSTYNPDQRSQLLREIEDHISNAHADSMITMLKMNQVPSMQQEVKKIQESAKKQ